MREILFRGKDASGIWRYGDLSFNRDKIPFIRFWSEMGTYMSYEVDPETVGQSTELIDKNGKKIFEGDIVQEDDGPFRGVHGVCHYGTNDDTCIGYYIRWIDDGENRWSEWWRQDLGYWNDKVTIIGNIHDNPELVRGQDE